MFRLLKQNEKFSVEKIYLLFVTLSTLLPSFGALDNNPVRWMTLGAITILFILYNNLIAQDKLKVNFAKDFITTESNAYNYPGFKDFKKKILLLNPKKKLNSLFSKRLNI